MVEGGGDAHIAATGVLSECAEAMLADPFCALANIYITSAVSCLHAVNTIALAQFTCCWLLKNTCVGGLFVVGIEFVINCQVDQIYLELSIVLVLT